MTLASRVVNESTPDPTSRELQKGAPRRFPRGDPRAAKRIGFARGCKDRLQSDRKAISVVRALNYVSQFRGTERKRERRRRMRVLTVAFIMHARITKFPVGRGELNS